MGKLTISMAIFNSLPAKLGPHFQVFGAKLGENLSIFRRGSNHHVPAG